MLQILQADFPVLAHIFVLQIFSVDEIENLQRIPKIAKTSLEYKKRLKEPSKSQQNHYEY
uniref:Uncharacterized protein n=1 Tax=Nelumbo nucifera TaxID=4432 RepID=A0A823A022_NELNU|nr:TPA_asm: hypothetical protein HUJ06_018343 [Nelumbo nucifera]